ncbi:MAG: hypothetical protein NVS3B20_10960 [Polyangiales bacterium]
MALVVGCSAPTDVTIAHVCKHDSECGSRFCSDAGVCMLDCYKDSDCLGPEKGGQCNAQGRCVYPIDASAPPLGKSDDGIQ